MSLPHPVMKLPLALSAAVLALGLAPDTSSAKVVDCDVYAVNPNILISSARDMTCRAAARDMRRTQKRITRRFTTRGGFRCIRVRGTEFSGQWRCVRGERAYRFEFAD